MTQKIKVTAEMEIEDDVALDGLSMDTSLGLLGTIKSYDIDYEKKKELGPKLTYDQVKEKYFHKDRTGSLQPHLGNNICRSYPRFTPLYC